MVGMENPMHLDDFGYFHFKKPPYDVILSSHGNYMLKSCCHLDHSKYVLFPLAAEPSRPLLLGCMVRLGSLEHGFVKALQGKGRETYLSYCRFHCLQFLARELSTFRRSTMHQCVPPATFNGSKVKDIRSSICSEAQEALCGRRLGKPPLNMVWCAK
jgi:hypothetical protein